MSVKLNEAVIKPPRMEWFHFGQKKKIKNHFYEIEHLSKPPDDLLRLPIFRCNKNQNVKFSGRTGGKIVLPVIFLFGRAMTSSITILGITTQSIIVINFSFSLLTLSISIINTTMIKATLNIMTHSISITNRTFSIMTDNTIMRHSAL